MSAGPLSCYLRGEIGLDKGRFTIEQGVFMDRPSPSLIDVRLDVRNGRISGLMAGGYGKAMDRHVVTI